MFQVNGQFKVPPSSHFQPGKVYQEGLRIVRRGEVNGLAMLFYYSQGPCSHLDYKSGENFKSKVGAYTIKVL